MLVCLPSLLLGRKSFSEQIREDECRRCKRVYNNSKERRICTGIAPLKIHTKSSSRLFRSSVGTNGNPNLRGMPAALIKIQTGHPFHPRCCCLCCCSYFCRSALLRCFLLMRARPLYGRDFRLSGTVNFLWNLRNYGNRLDIAS